MAAVSVRLPALAFFRRTLALLACARLRPPRRRTVQDRVLARGEDRLVAVLPADAEPLVAALAEYLDDGGLALRGPHRMTGDDDLVACACRLAVKRSRHDVPRLFASPEFATLRPG